MTLVREIRARGRHIATPVIAVTVLAYFAYHAIQGERGLVTRWHLSQQLSAADRQIAALKEEHDVLQHRVRLMRPATLDPDLLDERARQTLGLIGRDEVVIRD